MHANSHITEFYMKYLVLESTQNFTYLKQTSPQIVTQLLQENNLTAKRHLRSPALVNQLNQISWVLYFKETLHKKVALISAGWHWLHCVSKLSVFISLQLFNNLCKSGSDCRQSKSSFLWKQVATHQATCAMAFWLKCVHLVLHAWPLGNHSYLQSTVKYIKIQYSYQVTTDFSCLQRSWPPILLYPYWLFAFLLE